MTSCLPEFTAIVLAAQRAGMTNPLAERSGVSHKCLVPICGRPLIAYVLETLAASADIRAIRISVEPEIHQALDGLLTPHREKGLRIDLIPSHPGIADSVLSAAEGEVGPLIVTTADNVLLTTGAVDEARLALTRADAVVIVATEAAIKAAHPLGQRNFYQFADGGYSNCNLYGIAGPHAFPAIAVFREGGQFMKSRKRMINAFGLANILLMRFKLLSLERAMRRISKRLHVKLEAVVLTDGSHAIDVDNERTYAVAEQLLRERAQ